MDVLSCFYRLCFVLLLAHVRNEVFGAIADQDSHNDDTYKNLYIKSKRRDTAAGHEFSEVSRGGLLKILATFEEDINARLRGRKEYPLFTAQFGNNKYTKPYIYPKILATFEEDINARLRGRKEYPLFTAQFGNNKYTKPYIYPKVSSG